MRSLYFFSESAKLLLTWSTVYEKIGRGFWRLNTCSTLLYMSHHESRLEGLHRILNAGDWRQIVGVPRENGVVSPRDARFVWGNTVELRLKTFSKSWRSPVGHWIRPRGRRSGLRSRFGVETKGNSFRKPQVGKERIGDWRYSEIEEWEDWKDWTTESELFKGGPLRTLRMVTWLPTSSFDDIFSEEDQVTFSEDQAMRLARTLRAHCHWCFKLGSLRCVWELRPPTGIHLETWKRL